MNQPSRRSSRHSREYVRQILRAAALTDSQQLGRATRQLSGKVVRVVIEAENDEEFYVVSGDDGSFDVRGAKGTAAPNMTIRISPRALRQILEGEETPVEAFFLGNLRAKGTTKDLYLLHALFIALAEIAVRSPEVQEVIEEFQTAKEQT
jgi:putative sterol carrier protein